MQGEEESPRGGAGEAGEQAGGGGKEVGGGVGQARGGEEAPGQPACPAQAALPQQTGESGVEEKSCPSLYFGQTRLPASTSQVWVTQDKCDTV